MFKQIVSLLVVCLPVLLLSACGDSGSSSNGAIVTNQVVLAKTGSTYQEVRHIVLRGTNQEIGTAIARLSKDQYQARPFPFPDLTAKQNRTTYIQQNFPYLAERQKGIEAYYGWGATDLYDSSSLWYDIFPVNCSAIFFPKAVTATGHSFTARVMDFYTVDINQFIGKPVTPLATSSFPAIMCWRPILRTAVMPPWWWVPLI